MSESQSLPPDSAMGGEEQAATPSPINSPSQNESKRPLAKSPANSAGKDQRRGSWSTTDKPKASKASKIPNSTMRPSNIASNPSHPTSPISMGGSSDRTPQASIKSSSSWDDLVLEDDLPPSGDILELSVSNGDDKEQVLITKTFPVETYVAEVTKTFCSHFGLTGSHWRIHVETPKKEEENGSPSEGKSEKSEGKSEIAAEKPQWLQIDKRLLEFDPVLLLENLLVLRVRPREEASVQKAESPKAEPITPIARSNSVINFFKKSGTQRKKVSSNLTRSTDLKRPPLPWVFLQDPNCKVEITK